ncbi:MAG TPA: aminotransferase class III-fold pyridoxal phosphate-dependent enzyme [Puia sp.]|nr:aminotransferase class III-fold pyridoxal phosphate-dependent enzyme [Puia sp.]
MNRRDLFYQHIAQTSSSPIGLEISLAEGTCIYDAGGRKYIDLIGGISVCNVGHRHPEVVEAIKRQADQYLHVLVYGELIQSPQVDYATKLAECLPSPLNSVYFTNSGAEAVEGAMKLAKRFTNRTNILAFNESYHGSTQGALSIMGDEYWRNAYRPLLPGIIHAEHNADASLELVTESVAAVFAETVQAERGVFAASSPWLKALRKRCDEMEALLIIDEVQTGFGRTGSVWNFEQHGFVPDILLLGKALGGGLPLGAFIADRKIMLSLSENPALGHITTFGGHPLSCAAGLAAFEVLLREKYHDQVEAKSHLFRSLLVHPAIRALRSSGLLMALEFDSFEINKKIIDAMLRNGVLTDWFLFAPHCMRLAPPLTISDDEIRAACAVMLDAIAHL